MSCQERKELAKCQNNIKSSLPGPQSLNIGWPSRRCFWIEHACSPHLSPERTKERVINYSDRMLEGQGT